ncbi:MAG: integrin alpha [Phycisphaerales bacterium]
MPKSRVAVRPYALFAACGLALTAASAALGQGDPLSEPFPAVLELADLDGVIGFRIDGEVRDGFTGVNVASAGDVNGDGIDDMLIGSQVAPGESYVVFGRDAIAGPGFPSVLQLGDLDGVTGFRIGGVERQSAGYSVASAGDFNGDGIDDLVIGAHGASPGGRYRAGTSYVVFGSDSGFPATFRLADLNGTNGFRLDGDEEETHSGYRVARAGDINGDGIGDVIIGARRSYPFGNDLPGLAYVVFGRDPSSAFPAVLQLGDLDGETGFRLNGTDAGDYFGVNIASTGDMNNDGVDDLIIGATGTDPGGRENAGTSFVVFGRDTASTGGFPPVFEMSSLVGSEGFRIEGAAAFDTSGRPVAHAGDVNGDGIDDVVVSARGADPGGRRSAGSSYVVFGRDTTDPFPAALQLVDLDGVRGVRIEGVDSGDFAGEPVASAGDVNGDGLDDLIIGTTYYTATSYVVYGRDTSGGGFPAVIPLADIDGEIGFRLDGIARAVAPAGDINNDGVDDFMVASPSSDPGGREDAGSTYIIYGRKLTFCPPDLDGDGELTIFDFLTFQNLFDLMDPRADFDGDGDLTIFDFLAFQNAFDAGCP